MKKKSDAQLLVELRHKTCWIAVIIMVLCISSFFIGFMGEQILRLIIWITALALIIWSSEKYLQEHSGFRHWLRIIILIFICILAVLLFISVLLLK